MQLGHSGRFNLLGMSTSDIRIGNDNLVLFGNLVFNNFHHIVKVAFHFIILVCYHVRIYFGIEYIHTRQFKLNTVVFNEVFFVLRLVFSAWLVLIQLLY